MRVYILKNAKLRKKFCKRHNKTFGCMEAFGCSQCCPVWLMFHIEYLMEEKNYTFGEAYRQTTRSAMDEGEGRKIIRDSIIRKQKTYPKEDWRKE